jgi:hypothetical protein
MADEKKDGKYHLDDKPKETKKTTEKEAKPKK